MKITAFDFSLTETGYAGQLGAERKVGTIPPGKLRGMERIDYVRSYARALAHGSDLVVMEGYSFASTGNAGISLGELGGVMRYSLFRDHIPYVEIPPAVVKKFGTGKGNAGKDEVLAAAIRRFEYEGSNNNEADAWIMLEMARVHYGISTRTLNQAQRDALSKVQWPVLAGRGA